MPPGPGRPARPGRLTALIDGGGPSGSGRSPDGPWTAVTARPIPGSVTWARRPVPPRVRVLVLVRRGWPDPSGRGAPTRRVREDPARRLREPCFPTRSRAGSEAPRVAGSSAVDRRTIPRIHERILSRAEAHGSGADVGPDRRGCRPLLRTTGRRRPGQCPRRRLGSRTGDVGGDNEPRGWRYAVSPTFATMRTTVSTSSSALVRHTSVARWPLSSMPAMPWALVSSRAP